MKYHIIEGRSYPSVTTIINETKPESEKLELLDKARKYDSQNGEGAWDKRRETRSEEGKKVHKTIETWARELLDLKIPAELEECWSAAQSLIIIAAQEKFQWWNVFSTALVEKLLACITKPVIETASAASEPLPDKVVSLIVDFLETPVESILKFKTFEGYRTIKKLEEVEPDEQVEGYFQAARSLLLSIPEFRVIACEEVVANKTLFYAGQPDLIIQFIETEKLCLLDFKTFEGYTTYNGVFQATWNCWRRSIKGKRCPSEPGWEWCMPKFRDAMLQLCLYKLAWDTGGIKLPIKEAYIIVTCTTGEFQALPLLQRLWDDCMAEAIKRVNQFHKLMLEF